MLVFHPRQPAALQEVAQGTTGTRVKKMIRALTSTFTSQGLQAPAQEEDADSPSCVCFFFLLLQEESMVLFEDLRLCAVKPLENMDRRFCFELLSVQK